MAKMGYNDAMRAPGSHKGENGTVAVIGGSLHQHGAPLFSALAAEASGVDLLYVWVPHVHAGVAKHASLNFQVHTFGSAVSDELAPKDRERLVAFLATIDVAVIGPGLSRTPAGIAAIMALLDEAACPFVCDASALQPATLKHLKGKHAVLTPHLGELERMQLERRDLASVATEYACTFLLKAVTDVVIDSGGTEREVSGGNAGLTVGGTGDALAGLTAGLIAQRMPHADACVLASSTIKKAADELFAEVGYAYTTHDVIKKIPSLLKGHF